jgi:hypothetical protein
VSVGLTVFIGRDSLATGQLEVLTHAEKLARAFPACKAHFEPVVGTHCPEPSGVGCCLPLASLEGKDSLSLSLETMISKAKSASSPPFSFPDWADRLRSDGAHE